MQSLFSWAPKLARKCDSKHWYARGADGRSFVRSFGVRSRDNQLSGMGRFRARVELRHYCSFEVYYRSDVLSCKLTNNIVNLIVTEKPSLESVIKVCIVSLYR